MKHLFYALLCVATLVLASCTQSPAEQAIENFEDLIEELEEKKGKMTTEEFTASIEKFNKRYEELGIKTIKEDELSGLQRIKLATLGVRWMAVITMSSESLLKGGMEELGKELEESGAVEELNEAAEELGEAMEQMGEAVEQAAEE